ncbi:SHOCT domain-containing protein [Nocardiopsis halophila]|uniref:SHOCT domain-containing protein n=1 Tax=Nocardiopsis halophila TaxID=141692 RepID=UPI00034DE011|nr:SHOCT domain-containing protein [Nocardiopsis halophila]
MPMMTLLAMAAVAVMATAAWLVVVSVQKVRGAPPPAFPPEEGPRRPDPALDELRLRYARGEIGREEYLQRRIDLETD